MCEGLELYFIHVVALTHPVIVDAAKRTPCPRDLSKEKGRSFCQVDARAEVRAGEPLAKIGNAKANTAGVDLGMRDYRLATGRAFAAPDRHCGAAGPFNLYGHCYSVCPLDYATDDVRATLLDRFVDYTGRYPRTEEPRCGAFYTDRPGTAQGRWFAPGAPQVGEGPHLHLGQSDYTSAYEEISMGTSVPGVNGAAYTFVPRAGPVNQRFAEITDEAARCYESLSLGLPAPDRPVGSRRCPSPGPSHRASRS